MTNIVDPATDAQNFRVSPITNISSIRVPGEVLEPPPVDCHEGELYAYFSHVCSFFLCVCHLNLVFLSTLIA